MSGKSVKKTTPDIAAREQLLAEIERRDTLLDTSNRVASILLGRADDENIEEDLRESMELLGRRVKADRIHITRNETVDGALNAVCKYSWIDKPEVTGEPAALRQSFPYSFSPKWKDFFSEGKCVNGPAKDLPPDLLDFYASFSAKIKSILIIPVFLREQFWGLVSFSDSKEERTYREAEINILRSASLVMVTAVNRSIQAARIREVNERVRILINATPLGFNLWDRKLRNIETNDTSVKLFGVKSQDEYLERFLDFLPEYQDDGSPSREKAVEIINKTFAEGYYRTEWLHRKLDGTPIPTEVTLARLPYGDDYLVAGYVRDMRDHKKIMTEIGQRDLLLQIVNQAIDILLRCEPDGFSETLRQCMGMITRAIHADRMYLYRNHTEDHKLYCTQQYEWTEKVPAFQDTELTTGILYDETIPWIKASLLRGECVHRLVRDMPDTAKKWLGARGVLSVLLVPLFIQNEFWGFAGFDKCGREELFSENEESIVRSGSFLIVNALLRNESLLSIRETSAKLETALADAKEANNAKSAFLARMSHEIRTPLNAVIGFSELTLDEGNLNREAESNLEKIYSAGSTILSIVNDILDISKIESGKFEIYPVQYDTPSLINDTVILNIVRIGEKPITFKLYVDENLPGVLTGDDIRVKQIFNNLLSNAFKYTSAGTVEWRITFERDGGDIWLISSVEDTGAGIKPEDLEKLFSDYNQVDTQSNRKVEGTGLGLSITKLLVEMMDGQITVESEYGKGTIFRTRVRQTPVSETPIGREVAENLMSMRYTLTRRAGKSKQRRINLSYAHVLVVDDVLTNLDVVKGMLKPYKIKVDCATSGPQAIGMIRSGAPRYDAVFMDHMMPEMDGIEAVRIIREEAECDYARNIPVIALTANAIVGNDEMFLRNGFQDFVSKPIDMTKLDAVLRRWVRNKEREKEIGTGEEERNLSAEKNGGGEADKPLLNLNIEGINKNKALEDFGGDESILVEVLRSYAATTRPILENMGNHLASGNLADYAIAVHGVKGSSYGISAEETGNAARALEMAAKAGDLDTVRAGHPAFIKNVETLLANINRTLGESNAS